MPLNSMRDLIKQELEELYGAEEQVTEALPRMARAAYSEDLKSDLEEHLEITRQQMQRLEQIFRILELEPTGKPSAGIAGLLSESNEIMNSQGDPDVKDAALIGAAQKIEHYEMATYGTLRSHALETGYDEAAELLQESLDEEAETDELLTEIAENDINVRAAESTLV